MQRFFFVIYKLYCKPFLPIHYTLNIALFILKTSHCVLYSLYLINTGQNILHLNITHCIIHVLYCIQKTVYKILYTLKYVYFTTYTIHLTVYTAQFLLFTAHLTRLLTGTGLQPLAQNNKRFDETCLD